MRVQHARFEALDPHTLYGILQLRSRIFVVEQHCVYLDPDGRDTEPTCVHWWIEGDEGGVIAALRVLDDGDADRVGRVVTDPAVRSQGMAARLMEAALAGVSRPAVLEAQAHLADWYGRFGFAVSGPGYVEDGIDHVPMRRAAP
jgi:ElaA protein